jgi:general L-amino acid transport system permease protein
MKSAATPVGETRRPALQGRRSLAALWHSLGFRAWLYQAVAVAVVALIVFFMASNAGRALAMRGIHTGFGFLLHPAGFSIDETLLPFDSGDTFLRAFFAGFCNTLWVSALSLVGATILGCLLGIARLSSNWLLARISLIYVEVFRNTPQLIQIVFWYTLLTHLPVARQAWHVSDWLYLSNRGLMLAWLADHALAGRMAAALLLAIAGSWAWARWADARRRRTGRPLPVWLGTAALVIGLPLLVWALSGASMALEHPRLRGFNFHGGLVLSPEFMALGLGLSLYIAAYIAEIVRSGIQSVRRGQIEAGRAVGLSGFGLLRRIVLPQALRVIVPPITAQYISLLKTSSLGVAVGYPELFNVSNTIITISGHTLECVAIMGLVYLVTALGIAAVMNVYNHVIAIRGGRA